MRAAEAIRLGSLVLKPVAGTTGDRNGGGCALGMGNYALCGKTGMMEFKAKYQWLSSRQELPCDCVGDTLMGGGCFDTSRRALELTIRNGIMHLFNYHVCTTKDWTIDRLCEWLDSVDPTPRTEPEPCGQVESQVQNQCSLSEQNS